MVALPDRQTVSQELLRGGVVAGTLVLLGESTTMAAGAAAGFVILRAIGYAIQQAVGDDADHALLGGGLLVGVWYLGFTGVPLLWIGVSTVIGGWLLIDGVQHLRHGRSRDERVVPLIADRKGPVHGVVRVLVGRVLLPFRLGNASDTNRESTQRSQ
jgi:hypothetical protein